MSESLSCRWAGATQPRIVPHRHAFGCNDETCSGCQPCEEPHCRVCGRVHALGACAECLADCRSNLREIGRLCGSLPSEVEHRGVEGEAMMLLGPSTDPEAWGHREASAKAGRIPADYLDDARDEMHPLFVLGTWDMVYRDALEHDEADRVTLTSALDYLDRNLSYFGAYEHVPFEDMARDLRRCVGHLEQVLHDGEQIDEGVPCMTCERPLVRVWGDGKRGDGWECKRCREWSTEAQYRFAVKADYIASAEWLTDVDMAVRFVDDGVLPTNVRSWASDRPNRPATVRKRRHSERTEYAVEDVAATLAKRHVA